MRQLHTVEGICSFSGFKLVVLLKKIAFSY